MIETSFDVEISLNPYLDKGLRAYKNVFTEARKRIVKFRPETDGLHGLSI